MCTHLVQINIKQDLLGTKVEIVDPLDRILESILVANTEKKRIFFSFLEGNLLEKMIFFKYDVTYF